TMAGVGLDLVDELARQKYDRPTAAELARMATHGVDLEYVRDIGARGYHLSDSESLVRMRDHGVDPDFIESLTSPGVKHLSAEMISARPDVPDVFQVHSVRRHPRELGGGWAVILLPRQLVHEIESHARHRHLELLPVGRRVDAALAQLGHELGIWPIGEMARALAAVEPAITVERAG